MTARLRELSLTLLLLFVLLAIEFGMTFLPLARSLRPLILIPAGLMACVVGSVFMEARQGPVIVRLFIVAGLLWLAILLGLGSLDPLTRRDYHVPVQLLPAAATLPHSNSDDQAAKPYRQLR